ncbi:MAG: uncharacterized protein KVP18_000300 [Porospora cf. gigantea A]|uniref:uncharacterized protein n=1 Tax=Porospora cf. gigantea A TaxID=2853593 RepID=UPI00355A1341|nr:MAG: hypothetical protein KVP18_000300 [Porospora cf. gigantea A]
MFFNAPFVATNRDPEAALLVLLESRATLMNQYQILMCMILFAWINIMAQVLVYSRYTNITDGQWVWNDLIVILPLSVVISSEAARATSHSHRRFDPPPT